MNILLLGSLGQVGQAWTDLSKTNQWPKHFKLFTWDRTQADLSDSAGLLQNIQKLHAQNKIGVIVNTAAFTQVDAAETEQYKCRLINAVAPKMLAEFCEKNSAILIHYSTDYVYSGEGVTPHLEQEVPAPLNFYGSTKSTGDQMIEKSGAQHLIFRTSGVYSFSGKNFLLTMLKFGKDREQLNIVNDQVGAPTYAPDLAKYSLEALLKALEQQKASGVFPSGVYHLCNLGETSWFQFAQEIFIQARELGMSFAVKKINPILTSEYPTPAKRPLNSRLNLEKIGNILQVRPRPWNEAVVDCLRTIQRNSQ